MGDVGRCGGDVEDEMTDAPQLTQAQMKTIRDLNRIDALRRHALRQDARIRALEDALRDVRRMAREADTSPQAADRWAERIEDRINEVLGGDDD